MRFVSAFFFLAFLSGAIPVNADIGEDFATFVELMEEQSWEAAESKIKRMDFDEDAGLVNLAYSL